VILSIEVMYEVMSATVPMDMMMLKAIAEPMLMQWKMQELPAETMMAFTGTSYLDGTRATQLWKGTP